MILTGKEIHRRMGRDIIIHPFYPKRINPNSYNLRLGSKILIYRSDRGRSIFHDPDPDDEFNLPETGERVVFDPGNLILAETLEYTETHNLVPMLEGRSSIGRQFCLVHVSAGFGDNGFKGKWTLELVPLAPMALWYGMDICQIYYHTLRGRKTKYSGRYNENHGVQTVIDGGM